MRSILILISLFFIFACSTLDKNLVKADKYYVNGGVYKNLKWEDDLEFNRVSWFKELTLSFDLLYAKVPEESPFYNWFSKSERDMMKTCVDHKVVLTYAWDPMTISREQFFADMEEQGYERLSLPDFHTHVKMHPNFARFNIYLYKTHLLCRKKLMGKSLTISFPGFQSFTL